jgi:hypothetical protein
MLGAINAQIYGFTTISGSEYGIYMKSIPYGTPTDENDITCTASPISIKCNSNLFSKLWITGTNKGFYLDGGGLNILDGIIFQSCGNDILNDYDIKIIKGNESLEYGGGPIIRDCWSEGGTKRANVILDHTYSAEIYNNFFTVNDAAPVNILLLYSRYDTIYNNSFPLGLGGDLGTLADYAHIYLDNESRYIYMNNNYYTHHNLYYSESSVHNNIIDNHGLNKNENVNINNNLEILNGIFQKITTNLPTTDPKVSGQLWNDAGTLKVSNG